MKIKIIFLTITLLFGFKTCFAQVEKSVTEIRKRVATINKSLPAYARGTKNIEGISTEGAEATLYNSGKGLKKIVAEIYGETFKAAGDFYYQDEKLIFAYFRLNRYDTQIGLSKPVKVVKVEEKRLYFADGEMIKLLVGKYLVKPGSKQWEESKDDILRLSEQLKKGFED